MPAVANDTARLLSASVRENAVQSGASSDWNRYSCANTESPERKRQFRILL